MEEEKSNSGMGCCGFIVLFLVVCTIWDFKTAAAATIAAAVVSTIFGRD
jgi:hypothetical protein